MTPNCVTKVVMLGDTPRLILVAKSDIAAGTELLYDYGDRYDDAEEVLDSENINDYSVVGAKRV